jgi:hypothetical protein
MMIKQCPMRWAEHIVLKGGGEKYIQFNILVVKPELKRPLGRY